MGARLGPRVALAAVEVNISSLLPNDSAASSNSKSFRLRDIYIYMCELIMPKIMRVLMQVRLLMAYSSQCH